MAGTVRQPIDIPSLETFINTNVPEIKTPLDVKQVSVSLLTFLRPNGLGSGPPR